MTWVKDRTNIAIRAVLHRLPFMQGFVMLRRRWVVERMFAWITQCRRLLQDHEQLTKAAETLITTAATATLIRRWP